MTIKNDCLIRVLQGKPTDRIPVWIMRQAGRYLPEYRELRQKAGNFLELCKNPELASQTTLMPIARYDLDAAIIFSDILVVPEAMGMSLKFEEGKGPIFEKPIRSEYDFVTLKAPLPEEDLKFTLDSINLTKIKLNNAIPLIGFCGSPWTLACYMIEGGTSKTFENTFKMMYDHPQLLLRILNRLTDILIEYLTLQVKYGADVVMVFDTWGGILPYSKFKTFSLNPCQKIIACLNKAKIPNIFFSKGSFNQLPNIIKIDPSAIGLDWTANLGEAQEKIGKKIAIQGNLDPSILLADEKIVADETNRMLSEIHKETRHIVNLGHGITPHAKPKNIETLIKTVRDYK